MSMLIAHNSAIGRQQEPHSVQTATKPSRTAPAVKPPAPAAGASTQEQDAEALPPGSLSEDALHQAITRALLDGKLRPGTPRRERYLAESFGVTRGLVRKVLLRLGQEGKLEMHANRGAFVPEPTQAQIQAVYQARKAVEAGLVSMLAQTITAEQLKRLGHHLDDERQGDYVQGGWNITGDAYEMDADGYFYYRSRTDDMIISAGYNIAGAEVEEALLHHPAVAECAVVGRLDPERGQVVEAHVVLRAGRVGSDELACELQEVVKAQIAPYKYPRAILFKEKLPRTETGKLQRFKLRTNAD